MLQYIGMYCSTLLPLLVQLVDPSAVLVMCRHCEQSSAKHNHSVIPQMPACKHNVPVFRTQ
jgi:hypothetical protein